ncbi:carbohydrate-binding module family 50 protein [Ascosphaera apis ARSEF 7405]|uniref:Carbohydrate-binding module family 50 protein n=1 Tax=Ascosphaera apis ARSEF 7405 TaxID=392613 RepID=A0A167YGB8_9EURO|nr:carbohydrate-binding module family 50 protein [Ascosphaera apis ARSEF 7405]
MVAKSVALLGFLSLAAPAIASPTFKRVAIPKVARDDCAKSVTIHSGDSCWAIASANGISLEQLLSYNSGINQGCTNLIAGNSICVAVSGDKPTTTTTECSTTATPTATPTPGKCEKTATVNPGDSCWAIASANGISLEDLISLNPEVNSGCTNLVVGQKLCLAKGNSAPSKPPTGDGKCKKTYTIKGGDSCWSIANANGISLEQLTSWNSGIDSGCTNLYAGDSICVSK